MAYTPKDFQESTPPRIMGSESEYNVQIMTDECDLTPFFDKYYREDGRDDGAELWLPNGSRLYIDSGGLLEYATPEVTSAYQLLAYERAGEHTVQRITEGMEAEVADPSKGKNKTYKRSGYSFPSRERLTAGHHENYITSIPAVGGMASNQIHPLHKALTAYLSTRGIWAGAGIASTDGYEITQKHTTIDFGAKSKSTREGSKPAYLINETEGLNRLEIRLGDGNMSDWAIVQKYAFTSLVLRMIEHGSFPGYLLLPLEDETAEQTFYKTSRNLPIQVRNSQRIHPAMHQRLIAEVALEFASDHPDTPQEEIEAAKEIIEVCHQLEMVDHTLEGASIVSDRVDWAAKLTMLREKGYSDGKQNARVIYNDLRWEDIAADGLARQWYETHQPPLIEQSAIDLALEVPPITRAMARTALLEGSYEYARNITWHRVEGADFYVSLPDPYDSSIK